MNRKFKSALNNVNVVTILILKSFLFLFKILYNCSNNCIMLKFMVLKKTFVFVVTVQLAEHHLASGPYVIYLIICSSVVGFEKQEPGQ